MLMHKLSRNEKKQLRLIDRIEKKRNPVIDVKKTTGLELHRIKPMTKTQEEVFVEFESSKNLLLHGVPGSGKTFISLYLALNDIELYDDQDSVLLLRSTVPTRDEGFMPGTHAEKIKMYEMPYYGICKDLYGRGDAYEILKQKKILNFESTGFLRGTTLDRTIVVVDEFQNCNFGELCTVMTRLGKNSRIIFSGDYRQSDLQWSNERVGTINFMEIVKKMQTYFSCHEFNTEDIVRSGVVKDFILKKLKFEDENRGLSDTSQRPRDYKVFGG